MSVYHKATGEYYCKDLTPSDFYGWDNRYKGYINRFEDGVYWDAKSYEVGDVITVKYELAPGKNIIWKIRLESTATTTVR